MGTRNFLLADCYSSGSATCGGGKDRSPRRSGATTSVLGPREHCAFFRRRRVSRPRLCLETRRRRKKDRKSTRLNSSHQIISYAVFCLKKKKKQDVLHV